MSTTDTLKLALEAGICTWLKPPEDVNERLERFAALVAAAEREACAKVCEAGVDYEHPTVKGHIMENFGHSRLLAKAIRARGNT